MAFTEARRKTDGYEFHSCRAAFEADRRRVRELQAIGYAVLRFSYREVIEEPEIVRALRAALV